MRLEEEFLSISEFAKEIGYSESAVYKAIRKGTLQAVKVKVGPLATERIRVPKSELGRMKGR